MELGRVITLGTGLLVRAQKTKSGAKIIICPTEALK